MLGGPYTNDMPLLDILPVVSGPGPPPSTDHRRSTLRINRLHAAGKRQANFAFCAHTESIHLWRSFSHDFTHKDLAFKKKKRLDEQHLPPRWGAFMFPLRRLLPLSGLLAVSSGNQKPMRIYAEWRLKTGNSWNWVGLIDRTLKITKNTANKTSTPVQNSKGDPVKCSNISFSSAADRSTLGYSSL